MKLFTPLSVMTLIAFVCCSPVSAESSLPAISAVFSLAVENTRLEPRTWELRRGASCVLTLDASSSVSERWRRDSAGRLWYQQIFPTEKKIVEYQPTDLALNKIERQWSRVASVLDPRELQQFSRQPQRTDVHGRAADVYIGKRDGNEWEVWWLSAESIPARVRITTPTGVSVLQLVSLGELHREAADCELPSTADFEHIDFADLGDRHGDPVIETLMKRAGNLTHHH
jgi:hypothetical protein